MTERIIIGLIIGLSIFSVGGISVMLIHMWIK